MKYVLITILTTLCLRSDAQTYATFAAGLTTTHSLTVQPSFGVAIHKFFVQADMINMINQDQPVCLGITGGYHVTVDDHVSIEPSAGRFYNYYSGDKYDRYKNRWRYLYTAKIFYNKIFLQLQVSHISILSLGFKEEF